MRGLQELWRLGLVSPQHVESSQGTRKVLIVILIDGGDAICVKLG